MESSDVVAALGALAQETRLAAFRALVEAGPAGLPAGQLAERLGVAPPTLSFHLATLTQAGLVGSTRDGRSIVYAADFSAMNALLAFLTDNCCAGPRSGCAPAKSGCAPPRAARRPARRPRD
ncbi:MAG: helix-turn-helix transcriptional regulator [Alphaproteobacteria bacterium]|nr:helix-turn-helix transcriptional regulator [Alphaproteobacteria bacterium]